VHVREERKQPQDRDDVEVHFRRIVDHSLGKRMKPEKEYSRAQDCAGQDKCHANEQHICVARSSNEGRHAVRGHGM
jgi:hypothetical protein